MNELQEVYFSSEPNRKSTHYHDSHQIILILKGKVRVTLDKTTLEAGEKSLLIFSRYENHSVEVLSKEYERYVLSISPVSDSLFSLLSYRPQGFSNCITPKSFDSLVSVFEELCLEYGSNKPHREEMLDLLCRRLMITVKREAPSYEENALVLSVQKRLETDYAQPLTLTELALEHSVSPSKLSHEFKRVTGRAVMEYLTSCRIASAKAMLTHSPLPVGEIVSLCGFSDSSNFSRTFKAHTGLTPLEFRKKFK
ncbi:MAG: helix-turn-helix transcriptional regulator [Clostridia bacterium]|nr:helix-turn-helix transcriptional regulator [Clostridia bacterium]